ncbi:MAG: hypothetical protein JWM56_1375 [Candidatus Peribacteria bacterium]|nr:hypothetical protein [Candidatus Peribacteria bacterium]
MRDEIPAVTGSVRADARTGDALTRMVNALNAAAAFRITKDLRDKPETLCEESMMKREEIVGSYSRTNGFLNAMRI